MHSALPKVCRSLPVADLILTPFNKDNEVPGILLKLVFSYTTSGSSCIYQNLTLLLGYFSWYYRRLGIIQSYLHNFFIGKPLNFFHRNKVFRGFISFLESLVFSIIVLVILGFIYFLIYCLLQFF